jgi:hypothetical protein
MKINEHKLATEIVAQEGKKLSLSIGQVEEVPQITLLLVCLLGCIAASTDAQQPINQDIQIMSLEDIKNIERHLPRMEEGPVLDALRSRNRIWYDHETMPPMVQAGPGRNAQNEFSETGRLGVMSGLALRAMRSLTSSSDPLAAVPGGTFRSSNVSSALLLVLPNRPNGRVYPFVWYTEELEGFTDPDATVTGFDYTFPIGTLALEPIAVNDLENRQHYISIVRARIRAKDYYVPLTMSPVRTADECREVIQALRPNWRQDPQIFNFMHHLGSERMVKVTRRDGTPGNRNFQEAPNSIFTVTAMVDTLPPLPADLVRDILTKIPFKESSGYEWKPGCPAPTTQEAFHIVPQFYEGPYISMDSTGCVMCHEEVQISARRHDPNNGKIAWMGGSKEGYISVHHVEPSTLSNTPTSEVRPRKKWLDAGVIAKYTDDPVRFPKSVYNRIVVPTQGRFK